MSEAIEAFPLSWPAGWKRTPVRNPSRFKVSLARARDELIREINRMGGTRVILSTNIPLRKDGLPYAGQAQPKDPAAAAYFHYKGKPMCFACDSWNKVEDNVWAICKTIEALRGIERWGASDMLDRAFTGFAALPSPAKEWWDVLRVPRTATPDEVKKARNKLAMKYHPDNGESPSAEMMSKINQAYEQFERGDR